MKAANSLPKTGRRSSMAALERRKAILSVLAQRRESTGKELADEFGVSWRTIQDDILELSLHHPIETFRGNGGGIRMMDGYYPDTIKMTQEQTRVIKKAMALFEGEDKAVMESVLRMFGAK